MRIRNNPFFSLLNNLWLFLNVKRKKQLLFLLITIFLSGIAEIVSLGSFIPFLGVLISKDDFNYHPFFNTLINQLGVRSQTSILLLFTIIFAFSALLATIMRLINLWTTEKIVADIGSDFSCDAYRKSLCQPYYVHIQRNSSELIKTITLQIDTTITVINQTLRMITSLVIFSFLLIFLIYADWQIAIISFIFFTSFYGLIIKFSKRVLVRNSNRIDTSRFKQIKFIQEGLGSIKDVIINCKQMIYVNSYKSVDLPLRYLLAQNRLIANSPRFLIEGVSLIFISFLSFFLIKDRGESAQVLPIIGAIALSAQRMLPALQQIFRSWASIKSNSADLKAVFKLLGQKVPNKNIYKNVEQLKFSFDIKFRDVFFKYKKSSNYVLKDINLSISKGDIIGIIGETGSGKSTFIDLLMCLLNPSKGEILIDGESINNNLLLMQKWYASISHVPQDIFLNDASIAENIAFGTSREELNYDRLSIAANKAQILDFILSLPKGFHTIVGERGINLSGGQRQRISIARSLYQESPIIIFDEATSALDNKTESLIMKSIKDFSKDITIVMVAHRISSLKNCTKIFKFHKGMLENVLTNFDIDKL